MAERKPLSKRTRFEVFKRDGFSCTYCGQRPPTVVLHVDHILPVCEGGSDALTNLTTACMSCNIGKSGVLLTTVPESIEAKRLEMIERAEQERAFVKFVKAKRKRQDRQLAEIAVALWGDGYCFGERAAISVRNFLDRLPYDYLLKAAELARIRMPLNSPRVFKYFCGVCWREIKGDAKNDGEVS